MSVDVRGHEEQAFGWAQRPQRLRQVLADAVFGTGMDHGECASQEQKAEDHFVHGSSQRGDLYLVVLCHMVPRKHLKASHSLPARRRTISVRIFRCPKLLHVKNEPSYPPYLILQVWTVQMVQILNLSCKQQQIPGLPFPDEACGAERIPALMRSLLHLYRKV